MSEMKIDKKLRVKQIEIADNHGKIGHNSNVSILVQETHEQLNEMKQRHCPINFFDTMKSSDFDELEGGFFVHLVLYGEGETVAIVPKSKDGIRKLALNEKAPPKGGDYLKNECFIYFFNDYAILLSSGISDALVKDFFTVLLRRSNSITNDQKIIVNDVADSDAVTKIRKYGVKQIKLKTRIDAGTWYSTRPEGQHSSFVEKTTSCISKLLGMDAELSEDEINKYEYELIINHKGVIDAVERDPLVEPAVDLFNESHNDEEVKYEIVLNDGQGSIKAETLKLNLPVKVSRKGNSLDPEHIKKECLEYKKVLIDRGVLNAA